MAKKLNNCPYCDEKRKKKELKIIKLAIKTVLKRYGAKKMKAIMQQDIADNGFPMVVECIVFFTFRDKDPPVISTGWTDRPRVTMFHRAWTEMKLPKYEKSVFHED